ncbi:helix-turn-helix domain-containing protein [Endozoicomonas atrinae]
MTSRNQRVRAARQMAGLSIKEVAQQLGKSISTVHGWESEDGRTPRSMEDLVSMCQLYGITADWYLEGREPALRHSVYNHCPHTGVIMASLGKMDAIQREAVAQLVAAIVLN